MDWGGIFITLRNKARHNEIQGGDLRAVNTDFRRGGLNEKPVRGVETIQGGRGKSGKMEISRGGGGGHFRMGRIQAKYDTKVEVL